MEADSRATVLCVDDEELAHLMLCKRMMQSLRGTIDIATEHGSSTTVTLNFPVHIRNEHD